MCENNPCFKRIIWLLAAMAFVALLIVATVYAATKSVEVEFTYAGVAESYNFYMDGQKLCSAPAGATQSFTCDNLEIDYGVHMFTMTAISSGLETLHSPAFSWAYAPEQGVGPVMIKFNIIVDGKVIPVGN